MKSEYSAFDTLNQSLGKADSLRRQGDFSQALEAYELVINQAASARKKVTVTSEIPIEITRTRQVWREGYHTSAAPKGASGASGMVSSGSSYVPPHYETVTEVVGHRHETCVREDKVPFAPDDAIHLVHAQAHLGAGIVCHLLARPDAAARHYSTALDYHQSRPSSAALGELCELSGIVCAETGDWERSVEWHQKALATYSALHDVPGTIRSQRDEGMALLRLRRFKPARSLLEQARGLAGQTDDKALQAELDGNLAVLEDWEGNHHQALSLRRQGRDLYERLGRWVYAILLSNEVADSLLHLGFLDQALEEIQSAQRNLDRPAAGGATRLRGLLWHTEGEILLGLGRAREAARVLARAHEAYKSLGDRATCGDIAAQRGRAEGLAGDSATAIRWLEAAVSAAETMRRTMRVEEYRAGLWSARAAAYGDLVSLLVFKDVLKAIGYAEQAKSRTFLDAMATARSERLATLSGKEGEELLALRRRISSLQYHLALTQSSALTRDISTVATQKTDALKDELRKELDQALSDYENLSTAAQLRARRGKPLAGQQVVSLQTLAACLDKGTLLLEYFSTESQLFVFVLHREMLTAVDLDVKPSWMEEQVRRVRSSIEAGGELLGLQQDLEELGRYLLDPVKSHLNGRKHVVIVPHGILHLLPFHALRLDGSYCIEQWTFSYAPSLRVLYYCLTRSKLPTSTFAAVGNPDGTLPGSETEVAEVWRQFSFGAARTGAGGTRQWVKDVATRCDVLHLACHAHFDAEAPLFSYLRLAGADDADARLAGYEILESLIAPDLVTLSACQTAVAHVAGGDELSSLTRAFFEAGAASVVASLWCVDDPATARLMAEFYRALHSVNRAEALCASQRQLLRQPDLSHPRLWAAFVLCGDWRHVPGSDGAWPRQPLEVWPGFVELAGADPFADGALASQYLLAPDEKPFKVSQVTTDHPDLLQARFSPADSDHSGVVEIRMASEEVQRLPVCEGNLSLQTDRGEVQIPYRLKFRSVPHLVWTPPERKRLARLNRRLFTASLRNTGTASATIEFAKSQSVDRGVVLRGAPESGFSLPAGDAIPFEVEFDYDEPGPRQRKTCLQARAQGMKQAASRTVEADCLPLPRLAGAAGWMALGAVACAAVCAAGPRCMGLLFPKLASPTTSDVALQLQQFGITALCAAAILAGVSLVAGLLRNPGERPAGLLKKALTRSLAGFFLGPLAAIGAYLLSIIWIIVVLILGVVGAIVLAILNSLGAGIHVTSQVLDPVFVWGIAILALLVAGVGMGYMAIPKENEDRDETLPLMIGIGAALCFLVWPMVRTVHGMLWQICLSFSFYSHLGLVFGLGAGAAAGWLAAQERTLTATTSATHGRVGGLLVLFVIAALAAGSDPIRWRAPVLLDRPIEQPSSPESVPQRQRKPDQARTRENRRSFPSADRMRQEASPPSDRFSRKVPATPQPAPAATLRGAVLFSAFDGGLGGRRSPGPWRVFLKSMRLVNGSLAIDCRRPGLSDFILHEANWSNYSLRAKLEHRGGGLGFIVRYNPKNRQCYELSLVDDDSLTPNQGQASLCLRRIELRQAPGKSTLERANEEELGRAPYVVKRSEFRTLRLDALGSTVKVYLDGVLLIDATDPAAAALFSGGIGISAWAIGSNPSRATVRDLQVVGVAPP